MDSDAILGFSESVWRARKCGKFIKKVREFEGINLKVPSSFGSDEAKEFVSVELSAAAVGRKKVNGGL